MNKIIFFLIFAVAIFSGWRMLGSSSSSSLPLIVMTQIVDHDALENERKGIMSALRDKGFIEGKTITVLYKSAQGNITTAQQIANDFASRRPAVAIGISTPSAQSLVRSMEKYGIPVIFSAVTDPVEAKLVSAWQGSRPENVTGVSDGVPAASQFELIRTLFPSLKNLGILYNPGEINSARLVAGMRSLALEAGITLLPVTTSKTADTISAAQNLADKAEAIFIPNDNTVMASISSVAALAQEHKIPLFNPDIDAVRKGILAARGCSHFAMGYKAGLMVARILNGEKASAIAIKAGGTQELAINITLAEQMNISIPAAMKETATLVR